MVQLWKKKHLMVMVGRWQNHWKTIDGNGALKKNITIPLLEKKYHRTGLVVFVIKTQVDKVNPKSIF